MLQPDKAVWVDLATRRTTPTDLPIAEIKPAFVKLAPDDSAIAYHRIENGRPDGSLDTIALRRPGAARGIRSSGRWIRSGRTTANSHGGNATGDQTHAGIVPADGSRPIQDVVTDRQHVAECVVDGQLAHRGCEERDGVWNIWEVDVATRAAVR